MATIAPAGPAPTAAAPAGLARRRRRVIVAAVVLVIVLLAAEATVRVEAHNLPAPQLWSAPEAQVKYAQMQALHRAHQTGGVVFIGTSLTDVGIDPAVLSADIAHRLPVYNASLSGGTLETALWWYQHVVVPLLHPRVVVIGLTSREVNLNDPDAAGLAQQFFASPAVRQLSGTESLMQRLERYGDDTSYLFRYRTSLRTLTTAVHHKSQVDVEKPFVTAQGMELALATHGFYRNASVDQFFRTTITRDFQVGSSKIAALTSLLAAVPQSGARALLVDMPITSDYITLHPNQWLDFVKYEEALQAVVKQTGVTELPLQVWAHPDFADPIHLNEVGARRLTPMLVPDVRRLLSPPAP
jgi:hypothetical protein